MLRLRHWSQHAVDDVPVGSCSYLHTAEKGSILKGQISHILYSIYFFLNRTLTCYYYESNIFLSKKKKKSPTCIQQKVEFPASFHNPISPRKPLFFQTLNGVSLGPGSLAWRFLRRRTELFQALLGRSPALCETPRRCTRLSKGLLRPWQVPRGAPQLLGGSLADTARGSASHRVGLAWRCIGSPRCGAGSLRRRGLSPALRGLPNVFCGALAGTGRGFPRLCGALLGTSQGSPRCCLGFSQVLCGALTCTALGPPKYCMGLS